MSVKTKILSASVGLALVFPVITISHAQQQPTEVTETFGNWSYRCRQVQPQGEIKPDADKANVPSKMSCETLQVVRDEKGNVIAQIAFGVVPTSPDAIIAVFQVPQNTLLSSPVKFGSEDLATAIEANYVTCFQSICLARTSTTKDQLASLASAADKGAMEFKDRSGRSIRVLLSFDGLTSALQRLVTK